MPLNVQLLILLSYCGEGVQYAHRRVINYFYYDVLRPLNSPPMHTPINHNCMGDVKCDRPRLSTLTALITMVLLCTLLRTERTFNEKIMNEGRRFFFYGLVVRGKSYLWDVTHCDGREFAREKVGLYPYLSRVLFYNGRRKHVGGAATNKKSFVSPGHTTIEAKTVTRNP